MSICVPIHTGKPYHVHIGKSLLASTGTLAKEVAASCRAVIVSDSNVAPLYAQTVLDSLTAAGYTPCVYTFPAGEDSKSLSQLEALLEYLATEEITRSDLLIALGGGVTGDLTGFAASIYLRGIKYIQIPTSLLAAVDSSVGGKTAVNLKAGKNLTGSFWQPILVICDTTTFDTLSEACILDGVSESIKYGIIRDNVLFTEIARGGYETKREEIIAACVAMKGSIVAEDEFDNGVRELLNYGHTLGHGIEALSGFTVSHGHAVAIGMCLAAKVSASLGLCGEDCKNEIIAAIEKLSLPTTTEYTVSSMLPVILKDKKRRGSTIDLILPRAVGNCVIHPVRVDLLEEILTTSL